MPVSQQPVLSSHIKEPTGQLVVCRASRLRGTAKIFLPVISSAISFAATKPKLACRTSNAETKVFDSILKECVELRKSWVGNE